MYLLFVDLVAAVKQKIKVPVSESSSNRAPLQTSVNTGMHNEKSQALTTVSDQGFPMPDLNL